MALIWYHLFMYRANLSEIQTDNDKLQTKTDVVQIRPKFITRHMFIMFIGWAEALGKKCL